MMYGEDAARLARPWDRVLVSIGGCLAEPARLLDTVRHDRELSNTVILTGTFISGVHRRALGHRGVAGRRSCEVTAIFETAIAPWRNSGLKAEALQAGLSRNLPPPSTIVPDKRGKKHAV